MVCADDAACDVNMGVDELPDPQGETTKGKAFNKPMKYFLTVL